MSPMGRQIHRKVVIETKTLVFNGGDLVLYIRVVEPSRPKLWVEGMTYKFNSKLSRTLKIPKKAAVKIMESIGWPIRNFN